MAARLLHSCLVLALLCSASVPAAAKDGAKVPPKARAKQRVQEPTIVSVLSATHPQLAQTSLAAGSLLRIAGVGFGEPAETRALIKAAGIEDGVALTVVSWQDQEIVLQLPSVAQLGIDGATAAELAKEVHAQKPLVSMSVSVHLLRGSASLMEPIALRIALAAYDFDGDGVSRAKDSNDLDAQVH